MFHEHLIWLKKISDHEPEGDVHTTSNFLPPLHGPMQPIA